MEDKQFSILVLMLSCIFYVLIGANKSEQRDIWNKEYAKYRQSLIKWTEALDEDA
jgi:hypothetical protein